MPDATDRRSNSALWLGLVITLLGVLSNFLYFLKMPQAVIPWINLIVPAIGLIFLFIGLRRAFGQSQIYLGKIWGSIVTALSLVLFALSIWGFFHSRGVPGASAAPQVGQRIPDFTLPDSKGEPVSLSQLLSTPAGDSHPTRALLLIFYRGHW